MNCCSKENYSTFNGDMPSTSPTSCLTDCYNEENSDVEPRGCWQRSCVTLKRYRTPLLAAIASLAIAVLASMPVCHNEASASRELCSETRSVPVCQQKYYSTYRTCSLEAVIPFTIMLFSLFLIGTVVCTRCQRQKDDEQTPFSQDPSFPSYL